MKDLTLRQAECLGVVRKMIRQGEAPTLAAIGAELDVSHIAARKLLVRLEQKGFISRAKYQPGSIRVLRVPPPANTALSVLSTPELTKARADIEAELVRRAVA